MMEEVGGAAKSPGDDSLRDELRVSKRDGRSPIHDINLGFSCRGGIWIAAATDIGHSRSFVRSHAAERGTGLSRPTQLGGAADSTWLTARQR